MLTHSLTLAIGGHSLLESYTTAFNRIMLENNGDNKQWKILLRGTYEIMAKKRSIQMYMDLYTSLLTLLNFLPFKSPNKLLRYFKTARST